MGQPTATPRLDLGDVKRVVLGLCFLTTAGLLAAGWLIGDPTENEFAPDIVNNNPSTATMVYCTGISSCGSAAWTERLRPGQATSDNLNAGRGSLSVFVVREGGTRRCIRLSRYAKTIRLAEATRAACHPPYG